MSGDFFAMAQPGVRRLSPYVPGKPVEELARELKMDAKSIIKLASNENPRGASPKVHAAIVEQLSQLQRYPDGDGFLLKSLLAGKYQVKINQITLGNGSSDILELVARAYLAPGLNAVFSEHAFAVYPIFTQAVGANAKLVPMKGWDCDLESMLAAIDPDTRVAFIANPNNPTGSWFNADDLEHFLQNTPDHVIVVLDEAYIEYAEGIELPQSPNFLQAHPNLLVSRTFSKAYGLAALRVGYSLSTSVMADVLNRVRQPFNVNSLALAAACAALEDLEYISQSRVLNDYGMQQLETGFRRMGLHWIPSKGNFICVNLGQDAEPIYQGLLREGVIVRPLASYGMPNHLRITTGLPSENSRFLQALRNVLMRS